MYFEFLEPVVEFPDSIRRAGFVIKTLDQSGRKVFANIVCHELVKRPLNAQMKEVDDEHLDTRGISNLRVPLDVGKPRPVPDKNGTMATACDVIFNPSVVERAMHGRNTAQYTSEIGRLALSWVEKEMGTTVRKEFKVPS